MNILNQMLGWENELRSYSFLLKKTQLNPQLNLQSLLVERHKTKGLNLEPCTVILRNPPLSYSQLLRMEKTLPGQPTYLTWHKMQHSAMAMLNCASEPLSGNTIQHTLTMQWQCYISYLVWHSLAEKINYDDCRTIPFWQRHIMTANFVYKDNNIQK